MEVLSPDLGTQVKTAKKGAGKKSEATLWKKFAAQLEPKASAKAKLAAQPSSLEGKSDEQLQLLEAVLARTRKPGSVKGGLSGGDQMHRPRIRIPHEHLIKNPDTEPAAEKKGTKDTPKTQLDAMLQLFALDLSQSKRQIERASSTVDTAARAIASSGARAGRNQLAASTPTAATKPSALPTEPQGKPNQDLIKLMTGRTSEVLHPGQSGPIAQILSAMGMDPNKLTHLSESGVSAAQAELRTRAEGKLSPAPPERKGRGRAPAGNPETRPVRPRPVSGKELNGLESVEVENRWEKLIGKLTNENERRKPAELRQNDREIQTNIPADGTRTRVEPLPRPVAAEPFASAIQRAAVAVERNYTETQQSRQRSEGAAEPATRREAPNAQTRPIKMDPVPEAAQRPHDMALDFTRPRRATSAKPLQDLMPQPEPVVAAKVEAPVAPTKAAAPPPPPQPMFSQVEAGIRHAYIVRPKSVTVRVIPEELGELQIKVSLENDKVHARIQTESQKVVAILKDHQAELQQRLQGQGIDLERLDVRHDPSQTNSDQHKQSQSFNSDFGQGERRERQAATAQEQALGLRRKESREAEAVATAVAEPVSIFDRNGRISLTA